MTTTDRVTRPAERFRPTRAGIVGLWDYTTAEFAFADGRLVLRGANGSGKTKALEVLFPFVLDGRLDARRLDRFSAENRTMKENLLWRGGDSGYGYAWMEFAGPADDAGAGAAGDLRYVTVGVGLQAQRHRPTPKAWFFVADGRVGDDLHLVDPDGRPRTKKALADDLGDGVVVERSGEHRRRVDDALFGLGGERYEAMLDLILTLRRPMLAKDLDPRGLSETLTRGLRPLDDDLLEQVARSFDDLEAVQHDLDRLVAADDALQRFLTDYRGYLRTHARHRADRVIEATAARVAAGTRQDDAHRALDEARAAEAMAEAEDVAARNRLGEDRARRDALRATEAFRTLGQLEHLRRSVEDLAAEAARADERAYLAEAAAAAAATERDHADRDHAGTLSEVSRCTPRVAASAAVAGVEWQDADADGPVEELRRRVAGRATSRRSDLAAVREALAALDDAERRAAAAEEATGRAEEADEEAAAALAADEQAADEARTALGGDLAAWADAHGSVVDDADRDAVLAAVATAGEDDAATPGDVWRTQLDPRRLEATQQRSRLDSAAAELDEQADALRERRQAILDEGDDAPPAVAWRGAGRDGRAGTPFWRLVRFADGLAPSEAAGIEAALEAAGLLDAWVSPDGHVLDDVADAFLAPSVPDGASAADGTPTLAALLVPDDQDAVPAEVVDRLLAAVRLPAPRPAGEPASAPADGEATAPAGGMSGRVTVWPDGRYRLGPLAGAHRVQAPRYIGATARANHRAARAVALDTELAELDREAAAVAERTTELDTWLAAAKAATVALPSTGPLLAALRDRDRSSGRRQQARRALDQARAAAEAARREVGERRTALQREARTRGVPASPADIAEVADALERFAQDGAELVHAVERASMRAEAARGAAARAVQATDAAAATHREATDRRREHDARQVELTTLQERMGSEVEEVMAELERVEAAISDGEEVQQELAQQVQRAAASRGKAEGEVTAAAMALDHARAELADAEHRLAVLARANLAGPLGLEVPADVHAPDEELDTGSEEAATRLLDAVDALVAGVSAAEERRRAAQTRVTRGLEDLEQALGAGYRASWDVDDGLIVVSVADDLGMRTVAAFAEQLATQRAEQEALLTARERALFDDALLGSICGQIHGRTQATRELVATMDAEMRARRLSSGQTVGVAWRADDTATPEWRQVHRLLDQDPAHFGPDQLERLRRHFAAEIKAARASDPQASYRELLAEVLDYRRWRRFELFLVEADGREAPLTKARHSRLSGGEKAASLHLPLFAAAHAAFAGARPACPRLLGLDEAFAGIADQGRAELLSLTVAFDLDLFMTGFDLWAVDASVPAVAHYDLLHLPDEHAVSTLLVLWNGRELVEGPDADAVLAALGAGPPAATNVIGDGSVPGWGADG